MIADRLQTDGDTDDFAEFVSGGEMIEPSNSSDLDMQSVVWRSSFESEIELVSLADWIEAGSAQMYGRSRSSNDTEMPSLLSRDQKDESGSSDPYYDAYNFPEGKVRIHSLLCNAPKHRSNPGCFESIFFFLRPNTLRKISVSIAANSSARS